VGVGWNFVSGVKWILVIVHIISYVCFSRAGWSGKWGNFPGLASVSGSQLGGGATQA